VTLQLTHELSKHLKATLVAADLQASINPAVFPDDKALHDPSLILQLPSQAAISALRPKPDFDATLGTLNPPRILLRPHHAELLRNLRNSLLGKDFSRNTIRVYGQPQRLRLRKRISSQTRRYLHSDCHPICASSALLALWMTMIGGIMGGGKSTTMFVAEYFFSLAGGLVITISGQLLNFITCTIILAA
jgi:hypothetical protein